MLGYFSSPVCSGLLPGLLTDQNANQPVPARLESDGMTNSVFFLAAQDTFPVCKGVNDRYLYADGIDINGGSPQPVHSAVGEALRLRDVAGAKL